MRRKLNWLLILQGWTMLLVVVGHAPLLSEDLTGGGHLIAYYLHSFAYSFHMPLFVLISGYLFYLTRIKTTMSYGKTVVDKLERLGIPFVVFTAAGMVLKSVFGMFMYRPASISITGFVNAFLHPYDGPIREFWFLAVIMWGFLLSPIFKPLLKNWWLTLVGIAIGAVLLFVPTDGIDLFCIERAIRYFIYFFLGMALCRYNGIEEIFDEHTVLILVFSILLYAISFKYNNTLPLVTPMLGFTFSISLAKLLDRILPDIFSSFRNYTYQIFLLGIFFQIAVKILYKKFLIPDFYMPIFVVCIVIGLNGPVIISKIVEEINWKPLCLTIGLKAQLEQ
jgi:surface polysaccharide O-acyltransferase-like enzyme